MGEVIVRVLTADIPEAVWFLFAMFMFGTGLYIGRFCPDRDELEAEYEEDN